MNNGDYYYTGGWGVNKDLSVAKTWYELGLKFGKGYTKGEVYTTLQERLKDVNNRLLLASNTSNSSRPQNRTSASNEVKNKPNEEKHDVAEKKVVSNQNSQSTNQTLKPVKSVYSVDSSIPQSRQDADYTYALIIANENYQDVEDAKFALNEGRIFKEYCEKTLGIPSQNIRIKENATLNNIISGVDWLESICNASNGKAKCIVYYSGHGIPDESTQSSYILPVDGSGKNIRTGYSLNELYSTLGNLSTESVTMFIDACFSGANRGNNMLVSARGVAIKDKQEAPKGKLIVFSATQADETAYPYEDAKHGMFTYYLLNLKSATYRV